MEKENKKKREEAKKADTKRIKTFITRAEECDPRVLRRSERAGGARGAEQLAMARGGEAEAAAAKAAEEPPRRPREPPRRRRRRRRTRRRSSRSRRRRCARRSSGSGTRERGGGWVATRARTRWRSCAGAGPREDEGALRRARTREGGPDRDREEYPRRAGRRTAPRRRHGRRRRRRRPRSSPPPTPAPRRRARRGTTLRSSRCSTRRATKSSPSARSTGGRRPARSWRRAGRRGRPRRSWFDTRRVSRREPDVSRGHLSRGGDLSTLASLGSRVTVRESRSPSDEFGLDPPSPSPQVASLTSSVANVAFAAPAAPSSSAADSGWTAEQSRFLADAIEAAPRARDGKGESERWEKSPRASQGRTRSSATRGTRR